MPQAEARRHRVYINGRFLTQRVTGVRFPAQFNHLFRNRYTHLVRRVGQRAPAVMAVCEFSRREAEQCFGIDPGRLHQTTEGWKRLQAVKGDETVLDVHRLRGKRFVLAVSRPTPNKNFGVIARALISMGPQAPHCVVVGAADAAVFAGSHESGGNLHHVGYVSDAQLKALYGAATCFDFPSFYERFGLPPLEAMPAGLPVVATRVGGITKAVEHPHTGLLVDSEDGEQHARAILSVDKAELHKMGQEARRRFNRLFCVERVVEELDDVYARVLLQRERQSALRPEERP